MLGVAPGSQVVMARSTRAAPTRAHMTGGMSADHVKRVRCNPGFVSGDTPQPRHTRLGCSAQARFRPRFVRGYRRHRRLGPHHPRACHHHDAALSIRHRSAPSLRPQSAHQGADQDRLGLSPLPAAAPVRDVLRARKSIFRALAYTCIAKCSAWTM